MNKSFAVLPVFATLALLALPPAAQAHDDTKVAAPSPAEYSLVLPYNMPHLMKYVGQIGLSGERKAALDKYANEMIRPALRPLLEEAQRLEKEIARAALDGQAKEQLTAKLDRLQRVKRDAAEIHISCLNHVRQTLSADEYGRLLKLAGAE